VHKSCLARAVGQERTIFDFDFAGRSSKAYLKKCVFERHGFEPCHIKACYASGFSRRGMFFPSSLASRFMNQALDRTRSAFSEKGKP
jgi:hypothetical protein